MKRFLMWASLALTALSVTGCDSGTGGTWWLLLLLPAALLLSVAILQTRSYISYCQRQRERGREPQRPLSPVTWVLYGAAALLVILSLTLPGGSADETPAPPLTPETTESTKPSGEEPAVTWMTFPADRELTASQYFVYDAGTGEFLKISGSPEEKVYPASITKLFTAYVAGQCLRSDRVVTVGDALTMVYPGSSVAELKRGDSITVGRLTEGMMLPSGNDAAYVLAVEAGRAMAGKDISAKDAADGFVAEMNRQAKSLGMENTHFANPDGIHEENHYSSFADLALLGVLSMGDPVLLEYTGKAEDTVDLGRGTVTWKNTNALIHPESEYYCPYAVGLKTGQTPSAGSCLLSGFSYEGRELIIGVFGCPEEEDRFADTLQLFNEAVGA